MVYQRQYWNEYDESKTETQNIENGSVVTSERLNTLENGVVSNYSELDSKKVDRNGAGQVRWANLAQDARNNISGGKVAIVGPGSVLTESVVDGVITRLKLSPDLSGFNQNRTEITYDDQNRVKMATEKNGDLVISRIELVYDALGRLQNITESANGKKIFTSIIYHTDGRISYLKNEMGEQ